MSDQFNQAQSLRDQAKALIRRAEELETIAYKSWAFAEVDRPIEFGAIINLDDGSMIHLTEKRGLTSFLGWVQSTYPNATSVVITIVL